MNVTYSTVDLFSGFNEASRVLNFNYMFHTLVVSSIFFLVENCSRSIAKFFGVAKSYDQLSERGKKEWDQRTVSMFHALLATPLSLKIIYDFYGQDKLFFINNTVYSGLVFSGAYFLWDFKVSFSNPEITGIPMLLHAFMGFFGFQYVNLLHTPNVFAAFTSSLIFYEASTIPLNLKSFLQIVNPNHKYYDLTLKAFAITFILSRCVWGFYVTIEYLFIVYFRFSEVPIDKVIVLVGAAVLSTCLNLNWGVLIFKKLIGASKSKQLKAKSQ